MGQPMTPRLKPPGMRDSAAGDMVAARLAVEKQADVVAARDLLGGQVDDMAKQSAQRRPEHMQDAQLAGLAPRSAGSFRELHRQSLEFTE